MRPSRIHLPACLRSTPVTASPRYYAGSDSCQPHHGWQVSWVPLHGLRDVLPPTTRRRLLTPASPFASRLATTPGRIGVVLPRPRPAHPRAPAAPPPGRPRPRRRTALRRPAVSRPGGRSGPPPLPTCERITP